ncbi:Hypothetical protein CINCED_3A017343 [Cinara cedri]|uniref:Uncharacterized protein n=1 Tax=Cinara cedri TaxID=506608 RepID=A0A5E4NGU8_9HEMI|nr:Hypothetical protein CINCED_3A017343 [Cinara cedri]
MINSLKLFCLASSISCYQCNSTDIKYQFLCGEFMDTHVDELSAQPCLENNANYCIKLVGYHEGRFGVRRFCSVHNLDDRCEFSNIISGDERDYRTCVYTCSSDGCNGSSLVKSFRYLTGICFLPLFRRLLL